MTQRESYDRYMYRKYKESVRRNPTREERLEERVRQLEEQIDDLQKQCVMLRYQVSKLD